MRLKWHNFFFFFNSCCLHWWNYSTSINKADLHNAIEKSSQLACISVVLLPLKASNLRRDVIFPPQWVSGRDWYSSADSGYSQKLVIDQLRWCLPFISAEFDLFIVLLQPLCNESLRASTWRIFIHRSHFHLLITPVPPYEAILHPSPLKSEYQR